MTFLLVDDFAVKTGEPRLDSPRGHKHQDMLVGSSTRDCALSARVIKLGDALIDSTVVAVQHYDKCYGDAVSPATVRFKFLGAVFADKLLGGTMSSRCPQYPHLVI